MFFDRRPLILLFALSAAACGDSATEDAGANADATVAADTGFRDASPDLGSRDLGAIDQGVVDAGEVDTGLPDAEDPDLGSPDTGVDLCTPNPCFAGVSCTNEPDGFSCGACPVGLIGDGITCEENDECLSNPCLAGSTCTDVLAPGTGFTCSPCVGASCPILRAQAGPDQALAAGTIATLAGSATGFNGAFGCEWTNNQDASQIGTCTATVSPTVDTIYTLTVTDASGATASDDMVVRLVGLIADAGPDRNILSTQTATLTAGWSGASCADASCIACEWRLSNGTVVASTCNAVVSPGATTQYFLTVTDTGNAQTANDSATVFVTDLPAQLCGWDVVVMRSNEYPSSPNPNYVCDANGTARRQTVNGKPAIVLSDLVVSNARITGFISVETTADDDPIGFVWGWQNPKHNYLLTWKKVAQAWTAACGNAPRGIAVKKIDGAESAPDTISFEATFGYNATDYVYSCADGWSLDRVNAPLLADNSIFLLAPGDVGGYTLGWVSNTTYRFEFYYTPTKTKIFIYEDDAQTGSTANLITTILVEDSSYPTGAFAFYSNSQQEVHFGDFSLASLLDYSVDAGPDQVIGSGGSASLSPTVNLAVPPYSCAWTDAAAAVVSTDCDVVLSPVSTTTYQVTVTDDFGRTTTDSVIISVN